MDQEIKYFIFTIFIFGFTSVIVQSLFVPFIEINFWRPDFVLIIVLLMGKRFGSVKGSTAGFILGLLQDSLSSLPVGITALPKVIAGYAGGKVKTLKLEGTSYYLWFMLFIFIHELITFFFFQYKTDLSYTYLIFSRVFPNTIYSTAMLFVINILSGKYFSED